MKVIDKRTYDDYAKLEGISSSRITLPNGKEIVSKDKWNICYYEEILKLEKCNYKKKKKFNISL